MKARLITPIRRGGAAKWAFALGAALILGACGRGQDWRPPAAAPAAPAEDAGYAPPPALTTATRGADAAITLSGRAEPDSRMRLQSPEGGALGGTVGGGGDWAMPVPAAPGPRLYGVAEDIAGRIVRAEGYVAVLPTGRPAAVLRAGDGAVALGGGGAEVQIQAVDYDAGGWAIVSGAAHAGQVLRLELDGEAPVSGKADSADRFALALPPAMLKPGEHHIRVQAGSVAAEAQFALSPAAPISGLPYQGRREGRAWRIDWMTPGGGVQTSLIFDP